MRICVKISNLCFDYWSYLKHTALKHAVSLECEDGDSIPFRIYAEQRTHLRRSIHTHVEHSWRFTFQFPIIVISKTESHTHTHTHVPSTKRRIVGQSDRGIYLLHYRSIYAATTKDTTTTLLDKSCDVRKLCRVEGADRASLFDKCELAIGGGWWS